MNNITVHAIEQFIRRWAPDLTASEAEIELAKLVSTSRTVGKTRAGQVIAVSGHRPEIRLVLKERDVCVTVLPPHTAPVVDNFELQLWEEQRLDIEARILAAEEEIDSLQSQVEQIDQQRQGLATQKSRLLNEISQLKNHIRNLERM